jgi:hypothetical protein
MFDKIDQLAKNAIPITVIVEVKKTIKSLDSIFQMAAKIKRKKMARNKFMMRIEMRFLVMSPSNFFKNLVTAFPAIILIKSVVASKIKVFIAAK